MTQNDDTHSITDPPLTTGKYRYDYRQARERIMTEGYYFHALLIAAILKADSANAARLQKAFPELYAETQARYDQPGGLLPGETPR
jgi:CRISPR/Cas system-associated protein endoribonuclease Cas2